MRSARWRWVVLATLSVFAFGTAGALAQAKLTIAVHFEGPQLPLIEPYIEEYERLNPGIDIDLQSITFAEYLERIQVMQAGGVVPDIIHIYSLWAIQLRDQGMIAPPPAHVLRDIEENYVSTAVEGVSVDGRILGYPTEINNYMLLYNKRLLAEDGYAGPPATWDELIEMGKRMRKQTPDGTVSQVGYSYLQGWDSAVVHPYLALLFSEGGALFSEDYRESLLHTSEALTALENQVRLFDEGVVDPAVDPWSGFPGGRVGMIIQAPWWESALKSAMGESFQDVGVAPIPGGRAGSKSVLYTWFWAVNGHSPNQEAAWEFLAWLNQEREETGTSRMGDFLVALGAIPSRWADIQNHPEELADAYTQPFVGFLEESVPEPNVYKGQEIKGIMWREIENAWYGRKTAQNALLDAKGAIDAILREYY